MAITDVIKDFFYFQFRSKNKEHYVQIAKECSAKAFHVYRLAHGRRVMREKDLEILKKLKEKKLIADVKIGYDY